jgi:hypothetical protein
MRTTHVPWLLLLALGAACGDEPTSTLDAGAPSALDATLAADAGATLEDASDPVDAAASDAAAPDATAPDAARPAAQCPPGSPLSSLAGKPVVTLTIDGQGPFRFVYDTGAPTSVADRDLRGVIGTGTVALELGGQRVEYGPFEYYDLDAGLRGEIDGLLGADVMQRFVVTLDVERRRYWLDVARDEAALRACAHTRGEPVELEYLLDEYYFVPGHAEDTPGWFLVDSGASLGALTDATVDTLLAAAPRPFLENFYTPAAIGTFWARLLTVGQLEVGGLVVRDILTRSVPNTLIPTTRFPDGRPFLGVLPSGYLRHFLLTLDHPTGRLRLDRYAGDDGVEPRTRFALGLSLTRTTRFPPRIASVVAGSDAERVGVLPGDELHRIDGVGLETLDPYSWSWALTTTASGVVVGLDLVRDGAPVHVEVRAGDWLSPPTR